jgi:hypothetical protein
MAQIFKTLVKQQENIFVFKKVDRPAEVVMATHKDIEKLYEYSQIMHDSALPSWQQQFVEVYEQNKLVALYYVQTLVFSPQFYKSSNATNVFQKIFDGFIAKRKYTMLLAGSFFKDDVWGVYPIDYNFSTTQIAKSFQELLGFLNNNYTIPLASLQIKTPLNNSLSAAHGFTLLPDNIGMELQLPQYYMSIYDYKNSLSKKYKTRVQKLLKQLETYNVVELDEDAIEEAKEHLFVLYWNIAQRQPIRLGMLSPLYFTTMKRYLKTRFIVFGFYKEKQLIGFVSYIVENEQTLTVHYIGLDDLYYRELYHCILLHAVQFGIAQHKQTLVLGRTGIEAKSMLGALPKAQYNYYTTQGCLAKYIAQYFLQKHLQKLRKHIVERHPFKQT